MRNYKEILLDLDSRSYMFTKNGRLSSRTFDLRCPELKKEIIKATMFISDPFDTMSHRVNCLRHNIYETPTSNNSIIIEHNNGLPPKKIAKKVKLDSDFVYYIMHKYNLVKKIKKMVSIPKNEEQNVIDLYKSGLSTHAIAKQYGTSITPVLDICKKHNLKFRDRKVIFTDEQKNEILSLWKNEKYTLDQLCRKYGVKNTNIIKRVLNEFNITEYTNHLLDMNIMGSAILEYLNGVNGVSLERKYSFSSSALYQEMENRGILRNIPSKSSLEVTITDLLDKNNISYECNNRTVLDGKEIDIYIPTFNLGIECHGNYWHNSDKVDKRYHQDKFLNCEKKNVQLLSFFEDDIILRLPIVSSIILNKCNKSNKLYARNCTIAQVTCDEEKQFLQSNHIQGYYQSNKCYGLYYNNELVMLMSIGKSRFNKKYDWEIIRVSSKLNHVVIGGFSKLFKQTLKIHKGNIISYCDLCHGNGKAYEKIFRYIKTTSPGYYYLHKNTSVKVSRYQAQKKKLQKLLDKYDANLTEEANMLLNSYWKIYNCGNKVFEYNNKK